MLRAYPITGDRPDDELCMGSVTSKNAYYIFLLAFAVLLGPFCFTNAQKTTLLQVVTSVLRWMSFLMMIVIARCSS